ncbi:MULTISPECIES: SAM-dependent methyltransferase [unclassified Crossiella]|uniref:SAM-dependent methyltransferase n=1 Tax=unclassified Crossiella TaxID=2620835 RepID=UPI001FFFC44B|nr:MULTISPECIES: SAM-dependent methyltransferase [unclassified Crossiella]MCK2236440.1 SAM-dependent methyltransferase [Crossiella sp. S99.2]MCK2250107.1 SAM-dependent methyltransferase [Crossiella sp. S99.1]
MTRTQDWVPAGVDITTPSIARVYDYVLGGSHNFAVDRATAETLQRIAPSLRRVARLNRAFMARAVRHLMAQGIRQFLDIGSGIPTVGNVHEIAQRIDPACRVVYLDRDPVAVAHSQLMLEHTPGTGVVHADMRDFELVVGSPAVRQLLDFSQPVGLLFMLVLHWLPDESNPAELMRHYRDLLAPGSHLALTHATHDEQKQDLEDLGDAIRLSRSADQVTPRSYEEIMTMFGDFELVEPGLVGCADWRADGPGAIADPSSNEYTYAGVARKR